MTTHTSTASSGATGRTTSLRAVLARLVPAPRAEQRAVAREIAAYPASRSAAAVALTGAERRIG